MSAGYFRAPPDPVVVAQERLAEAEARQATLEAELAAARAEQEQLEAEHQEHEKRAREASTSEAGMATLRDVHREKKSFARARAERAQIALYEHAPDLELARSAVHS